MDGRVKPGHDKWGVREWWKVRRGRGAESGGMHLGELRMSHKKWNTPLLIAFIAAAAQILAAIIHRL